MKFAYEGQKDGVKVSGSMDALDRFEVAKNLKKEGVVVSSVAQEKATASSWIIYFTSLFSRVKLSEKIFFASNLSAMLTAGLPLSRALTVIERQTVNPAMGAVLQAIGADINKGKALSSAIAAHPKVFSPVFVSMIAAGESSGKLSSALTLLSDQMSKTFALKRKIKGAMVYPAVILCVTAVVGAIMLVYIVPTLTGTFAGLNAELPLSTKFIIFLSSFLATQGLWALVFIALLVFGFLRFKKTESGMRSMSVFYIHLPIIGKLVKEYNTAVFSRTLASLVSSGVDLLTALSITSNVLQNRLYREAVASAQIAVEKGGSLGKELSLSKDIFPPLASEMALVGEETGKLSEMLERAASFFEGEVDTATKDLGAVIEPLLMVIIGVAVGFFAIAIIQPIYSIGDHI